MKSIIVSVIIPTYNRAEYLRQAIASVLAQTYENFELIVLDNCSPDHTEEVVASFKDSRIKYLRHQCNIGVIANWLYGIHWAQGEYFAVLGDDDYYRPHFIESRIKAFKHYPAVDAVFSSHEICDAEGIITSEPHNYSDNNCVVQGTALLGIINSKVWQVGSTLYRRSTVVDIWDESIRAGKAFDTAVHVMIALKSSSAWIVDKGLVYRAHPLQDSMIGGRGVLIGYYNAFAEPLAHEDHPECRNQLKNGAWWAYDILARDSLSRGANKVAQKLFWQLILLNPFHLRTWIRFVYSFVSQFVQISTRKDNKSV